MKKYILKTIFLSMLAAPVLTSCELDQFPETNDVSDREWETVKYASQFNVGLLSQLRSTSAGDLGCLTDAQSDLFNLGGRSTGYFEAHNWSFNASGFSGDGLWAGAFSLVSNANNVLNKIGHVKPANGYEAAVLQNYKANAFFARAYAYAIMAVRYCQNYVDDDNAKKQLGLPLLDKLDEDARPARANLYDTYKFIKADIDSAKALFVDQSDMNTIVPTYNATLALEARVSLHMADYANAVAKASELIAQYPLAQGQDFADMWLKDQGSEIIYQPLMTPDERSSSFGAFISWDREEGMFRPDYFPTQGLLNLYTIKDIRRAVYFAQTGATAGQGFNDDNAVIMVKFPGNPALRKDPKGEKYSYFNMTKVFRVAEMYLIAAEAQYMLDGTGDKYLNALRQARNAEPITVTGKPLFREIKNEWAREMCGEGFRLDGLKRWGDPIDRKKHMTPQPLTSGFLRGTGFSDLVVKPGDDKYYKIVWEVPAGDVTTNPNLQTNWDK